MSGPLKRFRIENHKGIVEFAVSPDGKSIRLEGANGTGKSSVLDALEWIVSDDGSEAGMRNGADRRYGEMVFGEYLITRQQKRGGKPSRNTPAAKLAEVRAALSRRTFSMLSDAEQVETVKRLAPGLDVSALEAQEKRAYDERTLVNRDAKTLRAQAEGIKVPAAPEVAGEERAIVDVVDVAAIAGKRGEVERARASNAKLRDDARRYRSVAVDKAKDHVKALDEIERLERALEGARRLERELRTAADVAGEEASRFEAEVTALVDPDTSAIDAEIATARATNAAARAEAESHNRTVRTAHQALVESRRLAADKKRLSEQAEAKESEARRLTATIESASTKREAAIAEATKALPLPLSIRDGSVLHSDVPIRDLNTAARIRLDVAMAAVAGHKLMPVRDASLLDDAARTELEAFAAERGIQLLSEIVRSGAPLTAVIEDAQEEW